MPPHDPLSVPRHVSLLQYIPALQFVPPGELRICRTPACRWRHKQPVNGQTRHGGGTGSSERQTGCICDYLAELNTWSHREQCFECALGGRSPCWPIAMPAAACSSHIKPLPNCSKRSSQIKPPSNSYVLARLAVLSQRMREWGSCAPVPCQYPPMPHCRVVDLGVLMSSKS